MNSIRHISFKKKIIFCKIKLRLEPFQALEIFLMLQIELNIRTGKILIDKIKYKKIRYLIFSKFVTNIIRFFNI